MFMIPMPPTTSEIEAMPPSSERQRAADRRCRLEQLGLVEDVEVVLVGRGELVALAQQRVIRALVVSMSAPAATLTPIVRTLSPPTKYFCTAATGTRTWSSGSWKPVPPFGWRMPMTVNGMPPMVISVPDGVGAEAEVVGGRLPEDGDAQAAVDG